MRGAIPPLPQYTCTSVVPSGNLHKTEKDVCKYRLTDSTLRDRSVGFVQLTYKKIFFNLTFQNRFARYVQRYGTVWKCGQPNEHVTLFNY
jgi:hypothetical protein